MTTNEMQILMERQRQAMRAQQCVGLLGGQFGLGVANQGLANAQRYQALQQSPVNRKVLLLCD